MSRPLDDLRLAVLMLDEIELKGRCCVVALGIDTDGVKHPLGLWDGSTENAHRRHDPARQPRRTRPGRRAGRASDHRRREGAPQGGPRRLGSDTPVQRCIDKKRNVLDHLPERDRPLVRRRLRGAWALDDHERALDQLRGLADELARTHPGAAASLRESMEETLTVTRLEVVAGSSARSRRRIRASR